MSIIGQFTRLPVAPGAESTTKRATSLPNPAPAVDPQAVVHALGFDLPRRVDPVQGGADTLIWRLESDISSYALRLLRAEQAPAAQREVAAMVAAREHGLPVPALERQGIWNERPAMVLSWMPGLTLRESLIDLPAAYLVHDLRPRLGRPDLPWVTEGLLERIGHCAAAQGGTEATDAF